jgi:hypothetical protein
MKRQPGETNDKGWLWIWETDTDGKERCGWLKRTTTMDDSASMYEVKDKVKVKNNPKHNL